MRKHPLPFVAGLCLLPLLAPAQSADAPPPPQNFVERPAIFEITTDVLNPGVEPFTVTGPSFGNSLKRGAKGGFEPFSFRDRLTAAQDSPDRVYSPGGTGLSFYDTYASGFLDGAEVRVYRVIDGLMRLVRQDTVPAGGSVIEQWDYSTARLIAPDATTGSYSWDSWNRPGSTRWLTVFAIDRAGNRSAPAAPVQVSFVIPEKGAKGDDRTVAFRAGRASDAATPLPAPQNLRVEPGPDGIFRLTWDAVQSPALAGYAIAKTDTDPARHRGAYLQLSRPPATPEEEIKRGDLVIVAKEMAPFRPEYLSNRVGRNTNTMTGLLPYGVPNALAWDTESWRLAPHAPGTPVEEPGKTYLEMTVRSGEKQHVGLSSIPDLSSTRQSYYPVPRSTDYTMEVWLKADRADAPPVVFEYNGDKTIGGFVEPTPLQPDTTWKKFTHTFKGQAADSGFHAYLVLTCEGPATYSIDNFRVYRADTPYLDYTPEEYARLTESGMMSYRTHGPIKTGRNTYSMEQFIQPAGLAEGIARGNTLPHALRMMEKARLRPWLQIEYHMSPAEWLGFVEYMAAPYDPKTDTPQSKPWAHARAKQGRTAPWTDAFDRIYFEISNETWNQMFRPWIFTDMTDTVTGKTIPRGGVYGLFHDHVVEVLRSSPYWTEDVEKKFIQVMGGWVIHGFNDGIASTSRTGDFITIAAYNGGWDAGEGPATPTPRNFFSMLNFSNQSAIPGARRLLTNALKWEAETGRHFLLGTYEAGPGHTFTRVTPQQRTDEEAIMKSKALGVATLDTFLSQAAHDFDIQNFFTFGEGQQFVSHSKWYGGDAAHPSFLYLTLFNREAAGDMLRVATESVPTMDIPAFKRRQAIDGAPLAAVYATREGDRVNVFVLSRRYPGYPEEAGDGYTPVGLKLPFTKASKITLHRATGAPTDTNIDTETVRLERRAIPPSALRPDGRFVVNHDTGGSARGLPPAEALLYVFEGTDIGAPGKTLTREDLLKLPATFTDK